MGAGWTQGVPREAHPMTVTFLLTTRTLGVASQRQMEGCLEKEKNQNVFFLSFSQHQTFNLRLDTVSQVGSRVHPAGGNPQEDRRAILPVGVKGRPQSSEAVVLKSQLTDPGPEQSLSLNANLPAALLTHEAKS